MAEQPSLSRTPSGRLHPTAIGCIFFNCGAQRWGVRLDDVLRILPASEVQPVLLPGMPRWIIGAFQLNAVIATYIDLEALLLDGPPGAEPHRADRMILIINFEDEIYGCLVTNLSSTVYLDAAELQQMELAARPPEQPYLLARYLPRGQKDPTIGAAIGLLDINLMLTEHIGALQAIGAMS